MRSRPESVADHLSGAVLRAAPAETLAQIRDRLAAGQPGSLELVCAVDAEGKPLGVLPIQQLYALDGHKRLRDAMTVDAPVARLRDDQEHAASLALQHAMSALAVVDEQGRLVGVLGAHTLLGILRREHVEDLHRLTGIRRETARARHAIEDPPLRRVGDRIPWLIAGLVGSGAATAVMASFEARLAANVAIAFFIPAIVYLADAVGTQTEAIAVRGLSLTRAGITHLLGLELGVGTLIGAALGALALAPVFLAFGDARLAVAVAVSIWSASTLASALGLMFPWVLAHTGFDPAHGSGPIATVLQDIVSLLAYFVVLRLFGVA